MNQELIEKARVISDQHNIPMTDALDIVSDIISAVTQGLICEDLPEFRCWQKSL